MSADADDSMRDDLEAGLARAFGGVEGEPSILHTLSTLSGQELELPETHAEGEARYEEFFEKLQTEFPRKVCFHRGHHEELAHVIEAGGDLLLMPSRYEPCGLNQMFSLRYGTIPIVRRTGGLADTVTLFNRETGEGTGIVFEHFDADAMRWALARALELFHDRAAWARIVQNAMSQDFSWTRQAGLYEELYDRLTGT